ncbi:MAG TPA: HEPN domain-containing protein [Methanolinea sp.]|nr:HEPN domain-containing protein [Methanolinea sp.]
MDAVELIPEEGQPTFDTLLFIALEDLDSSIILYHREHYPQSVFYLQQAVEKAVKSLGLLFEIVSEDDLQGKIGHNPLRVYKRPLTKISEDLPALNQDLDTHPEFSEMLQSSGIDLDELASSIKSLVHKFDEYISTVVDYNLSAEALSEHLFAIDFFNRGIDKTEERIRTEGISDEVFAAKKEELRTQLESLFNSIHIPTEQKEAMRNGLDSFFAAFLPNRESFEYLMYVVLKIVRIGQNLFYLSIITSPHATKSRYPEGNFNPLQFYTPGSPLIDTLPELQEITRHTLEEMDVLYDLIFDPPNDVPGVINDARLLSPGDEVE